MGDFPLTATPILQFENKIALALSAVHVPSKSPDTTSNATIEARMRYLRLEELSVKGCGIRERRWDRQFADTTNGGVFPGGLH